MLGLPRRPRVSIRSGLFGRLIKNRFNRWLALVAVATALLVAFALALVDMPKPFSDWRGLFENLDRSLITAAALGAAAYFWFNFWTTHWATRELLRVAQRTPEELFPHAPEAGSSGHVYGRGQLVKEISDGLCAPGAGPQIVVGDTGSGKTTVLLALASHLARKHFIVPIVLSLRDKDNDLGEKDFTELAVKRFTELVDPYTQSTAEADRLWRWMRKRGRIVVLADDLDRSGQVSGDDPYRTQIRLALDSARRGALPMIVTTRPSGLPPDLDESPIDLSKVELEGKGSATEYVLERAGRKDEDARALVERNIKRGKLLENAFYLTLLVRLLRVDALEDPADGGRHAVRLALLDADRARLCGEEVLDEHERERREEALLRIEDLAADWLVPKTDPGFDSRWLSAVRDGERFGLLSLDDRRHPQFKHEVLHAYFASRAIARGASWKEHLRRKPNGARMQLTLVLRAARRNDHDFCGEGCERLLGDVKGMTPDQRLLRATSAAEIAKAGSYSGHDREIAAALLASADAGPVAKHSALEQLEALGGEEAVVALWEYARDDDYNTRWAAVEILVQRCTRSGDGDGEVRPPFGTDAYTIVDPLIEAALAAAEPLLERPEAERVGDWDQQILLLKQLGWMLPSLRTATKDPTRRKRVQTQLQRLLELESEGVTSERGLEASIAQGFKTDARKNPEVAPDPAAKAMLQSAVFWYSQLNLVHALALRMATNSDYGARSLKPIVSKIESGDPHPMLLYATKLCRNALWGRAGEKKLRRVKRVVWKDESVVVARRPRKLSRAAAQLVGEITVLLNLNETGSPRQRREFATKTTLPHCLQGSRRLREFRDGCLGNCEFKLCPFQPARDEPSAHRELSRAFCRDQRLHARPRTAWRWRSRVPPRALPEFWRWLESQARF